MPSEPPLKRWLFSSSSKVLSLLLHSRRSTRCQTGVSLQVLHLFDLPQLPLTTPIMSRRSRLSDENATPTERRVPERNPMTAAAVLSCVDRPPLTNLNSTNRPSTEDERFQIELQRLRNLLPLRERSNPCQVQHVCLAFPVKQGCSL